VVSPLSASCCIHSSANCPECCSLGRVPTRAPSIARILSSRAPICCCCCSFDRTVISSSASAADCSLSFSGSSSAAGSWRKWRQVTQSNQKENRWHKLA
jgi:hypothetical protein